MAIPRGLSAILLAAAFVSCSPAPHEQTLITGKDEFPPTSFAQAIGSLPINLAVSPDGRFAVTTDAGFRQSLHLLRLSDAHSIAQLDYPNRPPPGSHAGEDVTHPIVKTNGLYYGLAIAPDGILFAAQGSNDTIAVIALGQKGTLTQLATIHTRPGDFPAGLALDRRNLLYVANQSASKSVKNPLEAPGSVAIYNSFRQEVGRYTFKDSYFGTTNYPLAITVLPDGSKTYVASERDNAVYVLNTSDSTASTLIKKLPTGAYPSALLLSKDSHRLFVANADSDTISIVATSNDAVAATIPLRPDVARKLPGATPVALALSPDEQTLYVALGDMNAIAVVDVPAAQVRGYIPTGWYPSALAVTRNGKSLLVLNAKGTAGRTPNHPHKSPLALLEGNAQVVRIPTGHDLQIATAQVLKNNHYERLARPIPQPLAAITRKSGKITHVIYVIKENRTYDQVLGDMTEGNGDPALCLFPQHVTPNQHALSRRFGLLDNLYACGEVSGDGWNWSTQSMANPYIIRNVPYNYSQRGRKFDFEGINNGYPTSGIPTTEPGGKTRMVNSIPDVAAAPGGYLWELCEAHGVGFRNYGFYSGYEWTDTPGVAQNFPTATGLTPAGHDLDGRTDVDYRRFDLDYADSDAPAILAEKYGDQNYLYATKTYGSAHATSRFSEWRREFEMMLHKDPTGRGVPPLMMLRVPCDHTFGMRSGKHSPAGMVADNDYFVGQLVDTLSHSPIWDHTAIFIIEDDAQSGPDHVDCHRTTGYVISPYRTRGPADPRFYNTDSFLRTIEILLDLPPMTQYDGTATIIGGWTASPDNHEPYTALMPEEKLFAQINPKATAKIAPEAASLAKASDAMDFSNEDRAPAQQLNEIIWKSVRGMQSVMPAARTSRLLPVGKGHDDDDDD